MRFDSSIKDSQKELLDLLCEVDRVCQKNGINYSLHAGTMLGAVREHGFIPWDNDADISMLRADYDKLYEVFARDSKEYKIIEYDMLPKIVRKSEDSDVPFGWVDIFIYDYISEKKVLQKMKILNISLLRIMYRDPKLFEFTKANQKKSLSLLPLTIINLLGRIIPKQYLRRVLLNCSRNSMVGSKKFIFRSNDYRRGIKIVEPINYMCSFHKVAFDSVELSISDNFHEILTNSYGETYMTPIKDSNAIERHEDEGARMLFDYCYRN